MSDTPFGLQGERKQSSIHDLLSMSKTYAPPSPFRQGIIIAVYTADNSKNVVGITPGAQGYITYDVELTPEGVVAQNLPAMSTGGYIPNGMLIDPFFPPNVGQNTNQNTEETPLLIGQPVIVGFFNNSPLNGFILGPISCQYNAGTQTAAQYPQKSETWQGTTRTIDKNGNVTYNIVSNENFTIQINGTPLLTVNGTTNTVDIGTGIEFGVLGNTLQTFLNSVFDVLTGHTHSGVSTGLGTSGPPVGVTVPAVTTTKLKVQ